MAVIHDEAITQRKEAMRSALSLGPTVKVWHDAHFNTATEAVNFANVQPAQGPGEFTLAGNPSGGFDGGYYF